MLTPVIRFSLRHLCVLCVSTVSVFWLYSTQEAPSTQRSTQRFKIGTLLRIALLDDFSRQT